MADDVNRIVRLGDDETPEAVPLSAPVADDSPAEQQAVELKRIRRFLMWIFLFMAFTVAYFARDLLLPIVLAILITLTLSPLVRGAGRIGLPSAITGLLVFVLLGGAVAGGIYAISGPVTEMARDAPAMGVEIRRKFDGVIEQVSAVQEAGDQMSELASGGNSAQEVVVDQSGLLSQAVGSLASVGTSLAAATVLAMFLLASGDFFHRRIVESSSRFSDKKRALAIVRDVERQVSRYLGAITIINAGLGLAVGTAMWMLDMPMAAIWGLAAFLLNFLPFIGAVIGAVIATAFAIVTFDSVSYALLIPAVYLTLTTIEGNFVTPTLVGRRLEINTVAVLVTVMLWVWLWGVPGAFLAVPFLVVVKVVCDNVPHWGNFGGFLSGEPTVRKDAD